MDTTYSSYEFKRSANTRSDYNYNPKFKGYKNRWQIFDTVEIEKYSAKDISYGMIRDYYNGLPCQLEYVLAGKTVEREAVRLIIEENIKNQNTKSHIAILDAGGEGKTTALMQLVVKLVENGKKVYYASDAPELHIEYTYFEDNAILVMDNANHVKNIFDVLKMATEKGIRIIFAARANEWEMQKINVELDRSIKEYKLSGFCEREKVSFAKLLSVYTQLPESDIYDIFNNDSNQFLLAAMLRTMNGGINLEKIVEDIIRETRENLIGEYKEYALPILALICLAETAGSKMPMFLLRNICFQITDGVRLNHMDLVSVYLKKEVQSTSAYVETRHPRISELFYKNLVQHVNIDMVFEEFAKPERNIRNIRVDKVPEYLELIGSVSCFMRTNYPEFMSLVDYVIYMNIEAFYKQYLNPCKELFKTWVALKGSFPEDEADEEYSMDRLYEKAANVWFLTGNSEIWYKWAKYYADRELIGEADMPYTARWVYHQAMEKNNVEESMLLGWAEMETGLGNTGSIKDPAPYTARWIYRWGLDNKKATENLIYNWAGLEATSNHCGKDVTDEYTARWIYHWGITNKAANENLLMKWAELETGEGRDGTVNDPYTAIWLYRWGLDNKKAEENLLIKWAELERKQNGLGDIGKENTARWIYRWGLENGKADENLYAKWAEAEQEEITDPADYNTVVGTHEIPYSVRWIYCYALKTGKANENLLYKWIRLEFELGNYSPMDQPYTVSWLLQYARQHRFDERNYWYWTIAVDMEADDTEMAYQHSRESAHTLDTYGIFALVQGQRGILEDEEEEGMNQLILKATRKDNLLGLYCAFLGEMLYGEKERAEGYLERFKNLNGNMDNFNNKGFLKFWNELYKGNY